MAKIKLYDRAMKVLSSHYSDLALKLAFPDQVIEVLDRQKNVELNLPEKRVDFVQKVRMEGQEYVFHVEFQFRFKADVPRQTFVYSALLTEQFDLPVLTVVLFLERTEAVLPETYEVRIGDRVVHRFEYLVLRLWEYEEGIRSGRLRELAPLLALVSEEKDAENPGRGAEEQRSRGAGESPSAPLPPCSLAGVREEVAQMRTSTFIDDWIEEALQQGEQEGLQQGLGFSRGFSRGSWRKPVRWCPKL